MDARALRLNVLTDRNERWKSSDKIKQIRVAKFPSRYLHPVEIRLWIVWIFRVNESHSDESRRKGTVCSHTGILDDATVSNTNLFCLVQHRIAELLWQPRLQKRTPHPHGLPMTDEQRVAF